MTKVVESVTDVAISAGFDALVPRNGRLLLPLAMKKLSLMMTAKPTITAAVSIPAFAPADND